MLKRIQTTIRMIVVLSAFSAGSVYANDWFEQQRSISDGSAYSIHESVPAGVQGRAGPTSVRVNDYESSSWLDGQLSLSDGYSQPGAEAESPFQGVSIEFDPSQSFAEQGRRISDGTTG